MFSKTSLAKVLTVTLGLAVAASTANANCILVAADGTAILIPRGGCFYGGTEQQFAEFGGRGCDGTSQIVYSPEFNDRTVALVQIDGKNSWSARIDLDTDTPDFGGGGGSLGGAPKQISTVEFLGEQHENISALRCS